MPLTFLLQALAASENPLAQEKDTLDPTLFCTAYKRARFYLFTKQEPERSVISPAIATHTCLTLPASQRSTVTQWS